MKNRKFAHILAILLPLAAAILSAMPNAVKLNFASPEEKIVEYFSAFSMVPVGYAVWGAFGGGIGAIVLTVLGVVSLLRKDEKLQNAMFVIALIAAVLSLSTALLGSMTITGGFITVLLALDAVILYFTKNQE